MHTSDEIGTTTTNTQTRPPIFKLHRTTTSNTQMGPPKLQKLFTEKDRNTKNTGMKVKPKRCKIEKQHSKFKENNTGTKSLLNMH